MFLLHVSYPSGRQETRSFPSASARTFVMVLLAAQPVTLRLEDPAVQS